MILQKLERQGHHDPAKIQKKEDVYILYGLNAEGGPSTQPTGLSPVGLLRVKRQLARQTDGG